MTPRPSSSLSPHPPAVPLLLLLLLLLSSSPPWPGSPPLPLPALALALALAQAREYREAPLTVGGTRQISSSSSSPPYPEKESVPGAGCPAWSFVDGGFPPEHRDGVCDRSVENHPPRILALVKQLQRSVESGHMRRLKDERTWYCPEDDGGPPAQEAVTGPRSVWLFRNGASTPVAVSWLDPRRGGLEVSAFHPDVHPPHLDPSSVVRPGEWKSLDVFLGHTFQVRELLAVGSSVAPGRVLVRHRPGPVPVTDRLGPRRPCPVRSLVDPDPHTAEPDPRAPDPEAESRRLEEERERYARSKFRYDKLCNSLHRVFANRVGCPVDVYYAGVVGESDMPSSSAVFADNDDDDDDDGAGSKGLDARAAGNVTTTPNMANSCKERFKFHLGVNPAPDAHYDSKWDSPVAFESTYLGHKFVARLHHDPEVVVDEIVIDRTVVRDCPARRRGGGRGAEAEAEADAEAAGVRVEGGEEVGTAEVDAAGEVIKNYDAVVGVGRNVTAVLEVNVTEKAAPPDGGGADYARRVDATSKEE